MRPPPLGRALGVVERLLTFAAMLELDANRAPVAPKPAATVVVLRDGADALEIFCVRRHKRSGFLGGAIVFPGGKVDPADREPTWREASTGLGEREDSVADDPDEAMAFAVAASRELLEEAAILPVVGDALDERAVTALRDEWVRIDEPEASFLDFLRSHSLELDTKRLRVFARWVTPLAESRRYDTRFYVMRVPPGQRGLHDRKETVESFWATPRDLVARWERSEIFLAPPTSRTITMFDGQKTVEDALSIAQQHPLSPICPFFAKEGDESVLALPGDPLYPEEHPPPADPDAPTRFVLSNGRFVPARRG